MGNEISIYLGRTPYSPRTKIRNFEFWTDSADISTHTCGSTDHLFNNLSDGWGAIMSKHASEIKGKTSRQISRTLGASER